MFNLSVKMGIVILFMMAFAIGTDVSADEGIASDAIIHRSGLKVDWFTQSGAGATESIVDWTLNINQDQTTTFFTLQAGQYREVISQNSLNAFNKPFGMDGAVKYLEVRKEVLQAEFENAGRTDVQIETGQYTLPESRIYLLSSSGVVTAIDADNGRTVWSTTIGNTRLPCIGLGANNKFVAAVNGSMVYLLDAKRGKVIWSQRCRYAVAASPAVTDDSVYVPLTNGRMESLQVKNQGLESFTYVSGRVGTARPLVTDKTVSWTTSYGDMNVAALFGVQSHSVSYRLVSDNAIVNSPTYKSDTIYASSLDGFLYAIDEDTGSMKWEVSTGDSIAQSPVPIGDGVYVITNDRQLFRVDAKSGKFTWPQSTKNIGQFIGASKDRLYFTNRVGQIVVVNPESGLIVSQTEAGNIRKILPNYHTDRLYVLSKTGVIQSLREITSYIPHFHSDEMSNLEAEMEAGSDKKMEPGENVVPGIEIDEDPFKSLDQDDPFAGDDEDDPFAGDDEADDTGSGVEDDPFK